jgi:hypothetical protein
VDDFHALGLPLHVLVNNAGVHLKVCVRAWACAAAAAAGLVRVPTSARRARRRAAAGRRPPAPRPAPPPGMRLGRPSNHTRQEHKHVDCGFERTAASDWFGHVYLTELLLDDLKACAPSRWGGVCLMRACVYACACVRARARVCVHVCATQ